MHDSGNPTNYNATSLAIAFTNLQGGDVREESVKNLVSPALRDVTITTVDNLGLAVAWLRQIAANVNKHEDSQVVPIVLVPEKVQKRTKDDRLDEHLKLSPLGSVSQTATVFGCERLVAAVCGKPTQSVTARRLV
jgi:hypothetical protein